MRYKLKDKQGNVLTGTRHATISAAKRKYSASQRRLYGIGVFALPDGGYDAFPAGHPIPDGAVIMQRGERHIRIKPCE